MTSIFTKLIGNIRSRVQEVTPTKLREQLHSDNPPLVIDVREPSECHSGMLPAAINLPRSTLELCIEREAADRERQIILYCARGKRSLLAAEALYRMGYRDVVSLAGGFSSWQRNGGEIQPPKTRP